MKIFVATDICVVISAGRVYAKQKHATILRRYYDAFGPIVLCSRFEKAETITKFYEDISCIVDSMIEISLSDLLVNKRNIKIERAIKECELIVCRCPSICAYKAADIARKEDKPYLAECMGDPWDAYWNHGIKGKIIAPYMFFKMKQIVKNAKYAVYVTREFLQKRYPCNGRSIAASNVLVSASDNSVLESRKERIGYADTKAVTLMTTAAVDVKYKGQQYVIRAIGKLQKKGVSVRYLVVGEGDNSYLRAISESLGVANNVEFLGRLPLDEVLSLLDTIDIYIQPSLQEGLPRSVIEAMSRGCACIGSATAGIPELIDDYMVVKRKSVDDIVEKINMYIELPVEAKEQIAKRNFEEAKKYTKDVLDKRRNDFYQQIIAELNEVNKEA